MSFYLARKVKNQKKNQRQRCEHAGVRPLRDSLFLLFFFAWRTRPSKVAFFTIFAPKGRFTDQPRFGSRLGVLGSSAQSILTRHSKRESKQKATTKMGSPFLVKRSRRLRTRVAIWLMVSERQKKCECDTKEYKKKKRRKQKK